MKKLFIAAITLVMLLQYAPLTAKTLELSIADFAPKRAAFCEIFVEPN